jgi:uncharacterized membrane protein
LIEERIGKILVLLVLILLLLLLAPLVLLKAIHIQVAHQWATLNAKLCPVGEPLPQPNHQRGFGSYFYDAATNYGQHVRARVYADHA